MDEPAELEQPPQPAQRTRVTSPRVGASPHVRVPVRAEIDAETGVGNLWVTSLIRTQLRTALAIVTTLVLTLGTAPLLLWALPSLEHVRLGPFPLPWLLGGFLVYPGLLLLALLYLRQAEKSERLFTELITSDDRELP